MMKSGMIGMRDLDMLKNLPDVQCARNERKKRTLFKKRTFERVLIVNKRRVQVIESTGLVRFLKQLTHP